LADERCAQGGFSRRPAHCDGGGRSRGASGASPLRAPSFPLRLDCSGSLMREIPRSVSRTPSSAPTKPPPFSWRNGRLPRAQVSHADDATIGHAARLSRCHYL
jgi:hypothetical protein